MNRGIIFLFVLILILSLASCVGGAKDEEEDIGDIAEGAEIAMISPTGDMTRDQAAWSTWKGIMEYAVPADISHKYYQPETDSVEDCLAAIETAVLGEARVVVAPGAVFEQPVYEAQSLYPEVTFILLDGEPNDGEGNYKTGQNCVSIKFDEAEAGFLAGYAAVKEGYTKLGFMGSETDEAVIRYGYGYAQGAETAADEMGIDNISLRYHYIPETANEMENVPEGSVTGLSAEELEALLDGIVNTQQNPVSEPTSSYAAQNPEDLGQGDADQGDQEQEDLDQEDGQLPLSPVPHEEEKPLPIDQEAFELASSWYESGIEVIFASGDTALYTVIQVAEKSGKPLIGSDYDRHVISDSVITSAAKDLSSVTLEMLTSFYGDIEADGDIDNDEDGEDEIKENKSADEVMEFPYGKNLIYGAADNGIMLDLENAKFRMFDKDDYVMILGRVSAGEIPLKTDKDVESVKDIGLINVKITVIERELAADETQENSFSEGEAA